MDDVIPKKSDAKPTGRRYSTVDEFLRGELPQDITDGVRLLGKETWVTRLLAAARVKAGLTQDEMGQKMVPPRTQGAVSKLEAGKDDDLTLAEMRAYATALNERLGVVFGPPVHPMIAIKNHATQLRRHMLTLAESAHGSAAMEKEVQAFFGDAFVEILTTLATCQWKMPDKDAIKIEMMVIEPTGLAKPTGVKREGNSRAPMATFV